MSSLVDIHKKKGKRPYFDVYIGRQNNIYGLKWSIWSNPFKIGIDGTRKEVLEKYRDHIIKMLFYNPVLQKKLSELKGKILGCWCVTTKELEPLVCHGQVLMKLIREKKDKECEKNE